MRGKITLTIKNGKLAGKRYEFDERRKCRIGRAEDCEVQLPPDLEFLSVSRQHCVLDIDPPEVRVHDCGSRNGTFINGMQIGRPVSWHHPPEIARLPFQDYDLKGGDILKVGDTIFQVGIHKPREDNRARREVADRERNCAAQGKRRTA
jgi:pSer/pThr/pTyr-binding forkhead associated (FHA) protein